MTGQQIEIAPERIAEGKRLYELTATPVLAIAALMGVSRKTLERRIDQWKWVRRRSPRIEADRTITAGPLLPPSPLPAALANAEPDAAAPPANVVEIRRANALRIQQLVATTLVAIDGVLAKVGPADEAGAERSGRTLAAVARTLQEMSTIAPPDDETPPDDADDNDEPAPRDIEEFRQELARRLRGIIDARRARISGRVDGPTAESEGP